jgi:hypothetical protein
VHVFTPDPSQFDAVSVRILISTLVCVRVFFWPSIFYAFNVIVLLFLVLDCNYLFMPLQLYLAFRTSNDYQYLI